MANQHTPRAAGGLIHVKFDSKAQVDFSNKVAGEARRIQVASRAANLALAKALQSDIAFSLTGSVLGRGRNQRVKPEDARLVQAIKSERNRRVSVHGYTVGYLDDIKAVAPYYRGLETGTSVHVGRYLSGVFSSGVGLRTGLTRSGKNKGTGRDARFIQTRPFRRESPYFPGILIKNPIKGYHYFLRGETKFVQRGGTKGLALRYYQAAFKAAGLEGMDRAISGQPGVVPSRSGGVLFASGRGGRT